jgi:outer membrane lipoprotein LolB
LKDARAPSSGAAASLLVLALLAGCATAPPATVPAVEGRLSVRVDGQPDKSVSAGFALAGSAERGSLLLTGPLGTAAAQATWQPGEALLNSGNGTQRHADLDSLGRAALGEALPMAALFDWLRGRAWPGAPSAPRTDGGIGFEQLGWRIDLARWGDGLLDAVRLAPPVVTVRARVEGGSR